MIEVDTDLISSYPENKYTVYYNGDYQLDRLVEKYLNDKGG